ncbi:hypothetical protein D3C81_2251120 [compost metagenome]
MVNLVGVRQRLITWPNPNEPVSFNRSEFLNAGKTADPLPWHGRGMAIAAHSEAVITADQIAVFDIPQ